MAKKAKAKTLADVLRTNKIVGTPAIKTFLEGKRIKVITNTGGHNYTIGSTYTFNSMFNLNGNYITGMPKEDGYPGNSIFFNELELCPNTVEEFTLHLNDIDTTISSLEAEKAILKEKIEFLKETKATEFDSNSFVAYKLKQLFSSSEGDIDSKIKQTLALIS